MKDKEKDKGKFIWFCVGSVFGMRGISKLTHLFYLVIIIILLVSNIGQMPETLNRLETWRYENQKDTISRLETKANQLESHNEVLKYNLEACKQE
jgi:hypothetical protein